MRDNALDNAPPPGALAKQGYIIYGFRGYGLSFSEPVSNQAEPVSNQAEPVSENWRFRGLRVRNRGFRGLRV